MKKKLDLEKPVAHNSRKAFLAECESLKAGECEFLFIAPRTIWVEDEKPKNKGQIGAGHFAPAPFDVKLPNGIASVRVERGQKVAEGFYLYSSARFTESEVLKHLGIERRQ